MPRRRRQNSLELSNAEVIETPKPVQQKEKKARRANKKKSKDQDSKEDEEDVKNTSDQLDEVETIDVNSLSLKEEDTTSKLSRKELKKLKIEQKKEIISNEIAKSHDNYQQFSLSQQEMTGDKRRLLEYSKDINIESFNISAPGRELFVNAQLKISHKRRYGLVGPNGHGKTTLLSHIAKRYFNGIPKTLDILLCEQELEADPNKCPLDILIESDHKVQRLQREVASLEANGEDINRIEQIYEELRMLQADSAESRAVRILNGLGFTEEMQKRKLKDFSGGWRMRVSLGRALFIQPTLLLLDEPTNHLDLNAVIWLDNYLQTWKDI